jgi:hypothetical protein
MRAAFLLPIALAIANGGCTALVIGSGQDLAKLTTRDQVHQSLGEPVAGGEADGQAFEDFITHRKLAEPEKGIYLAMGDISTLGLGELYWFPQQLYVACRRSIAGQQIHITYDNAGRVTAMSHDGESVFGVQAPAK